MCGIELILLRKLEDLLKESPRHAAALLGLAFSLACGAQAGGQEPAALLVGSVRDQTGRPIVSGGVNAYDAAGRSVGSDTTAADGTFVVNLTAAAASVNATCRHCAPAHIVLTGQNPLVVIVTRYRALEQAGPDQHDLQALPYIDPGDAAGLTPFVIPLAEGDRVMTLSDRGLERGHGLILDENVPVYDPATGAGALFAFPGRSLNSLDAQPASRAFAYGNYAGGGTFALDRFGENRGYSVTDEGGGPAGIFTASGPLGMWTPAMAVSVDDDIVGRIRGDLAYNTPFEGGALRIDVSTAAQHTPNLFIAPAESRNLASISYVTVTRLARTFIDAGAYADHAELWPAVRTDIFNLRSNGISSDVRVERPGELEIDYGASLRASSGNYAGFGGFGRGAHYGTELGYLEAKHDGPISYDIGLSGSNVSISQGEYSGASASLVTLLPSATVDADLGGGLTAKLAASSSLRAPTLFELPAQVNAGYSLERGQLFEGGFDYDDSHRVQGEATIYRELLSGLGTRSLDGIGVGLVWQVAPRFSLRAWTLHDAATDTVAPTLVAVYGVLEGNALSRGVVWASYEAPGGLRIDGIYHRDVGTPYTTASVDADIVAPIGRATELTAGTAQRNSSRRLYIGIRFGRP